MKQLEVAVAVAAGVDNSVQGGQKDSDDEGDRQVRGVEAEIACAGQKKDCIVLA